ncbi:TetR/AcrR family transcriptional regulator [Nonomuraea rhodomycinica]|uniref:TetR/AcrR family transcriptional regulator n=1 Tax=Nonomuraea rhodomycinica TaxID=1712872 RepID=A0A7Y6IRU0_9ACTN|nr:TetR family transcriptional regulator [Nonomuraea rhodomycinica]NUW43252.1 TetR/AcrR family transcriptional regulator [Nonomuraea rhodomycinica]
MRRAPEEKQRDPERTKARILEAALREFAAKGFAGARVSEIAAGAGVNKQLISYYFGGKEGLYQALTGSWQREEGMFADPGASLAGLVAGYVRANSAHRDYGRLMVWQGLTDDGPPAADMEEDFRREAEHLRRRQEAGELPADVDPPAVLLALFAMTAAGVSFPQLARAVTGLDPASPEFAAYYAEQVARLVGHLGDRPGAASEER